MQIKKIHRKFTIMVTEAADALRQLVEVYTFCYESPTV